MLNSMQDMHFRFIYCVEYLALEGKQTEWASCFDRSQLGKVPIDCYTSGYGNQVSKFHFNLHIFHYTLVLIIYYAP